MVQISFINLDTNEVGYTISKTNNVGLTMEKMVRENVSEKGWEIICVTVSPVILDGVKGV